MSGPRRSSIVLPKGLDRLARSQEDAAMGIESVAGRETCVRLANARERCNDGVNTLEAEVAKMQRTEQLNNLSRSSSSKKKLQRYATVGGDGDDEPVSPLLMKAGASSMRRTSFVDEKTLAQAHRLTDISHSNINGPMQELTKWLNTEFITQKEDQAGANCAGRKSLRQILKVDDKIDLEELRHKKYKQLEIDETQMKQEKAEHAETVRTGSKEKGKHAVLRHVKSYRRSTVE